MAEVVDAIIPAGGTLDEEFAAACQTHIKALIELNGKSYLERVCDALRGSGKVRNIIVIGGKEVASWCQGQGITCIAEANSGPDNMENGLKEVEKTEPLPDRVLLTMCDLPLIQPEHVNWMLDNGATDKDIYLAAVRKADFLTAYPGCPSTFVQLVGEELTLGGMVLMKPQAMRISMPHIRRAFDQRKSKLGLAKLIGVGFAIKFLLKRVSVQDAEKKITSILGCSGTPLLGAPAALAFDVDDIFDFNYAKNLKN